VPVIATRHDGIPEVVLDGETGLLVEEGDTSAMAECMVRLLSDAQLAGRLGTAARAHVAARFGMKESIDMLWAAIEAAIGRHDDRRSPA
jgi:glycosyltransferase involved in cell wall biosynthesis